MRNEDELCLRVFDALDIGLVELEVLGKLVDFFCSAEVEEDEKFEKMEINKSGGPDVIIHTDRRKIVIEAKLDSPFSREQLEKYKDEYGIKYKDEYREGKLHFVAIGRPLSPAPIRQVKEINYKTWFDLQDFLKKKVEESLTGSAERALQKAGNIIRDTIGVFEGFPPHVDKIDAGLIESVIKSERDLIQQLEYSLNSEKRTYQFQRRFKRGEIEPIMETCFALEIHRKNGRKSPRTMLLEFALGPPFTIYLGIKLPQKAVQLAGKSLEAAKNYAPMKELSGQCKDVLSEPKIILPDVNGQLSSGEIIDPNSEFTPEDIPQRVDPFLCYELKAKPHDTSLAEITAKILLKLESEMIGPSGLSKALKSHTDKKSSV